MSQNTILKARGLFTNPNMLSLIPEGGLLIADNAVMTQDGIIQPRRGFGRKAMNGWQIGSTAGSGKRWKSMRAHFYNGREIHSMMDCTTGYVNNTPGLESWEFYIAATDGSGYERLRYKNRMRMTSANGEIPSPVDRETARARFVNANRNCYFTSLNGVIKLDGYPPSTSDYYGWGSVAELAGVPQATDIVSAAMKFSGVSALGGTGCLDMDTQRAFRAVWARKDATGNEIIGTPSGRIVVSNPKYEVSLDRGAATQVCKATISSGTWAVTPTVGDNMYITFNDNTKFGSGSFTVLSTGSVPAAPANPTSTVFYYQDTGIAAPAGAQSAAYVSGSVNPKVGYNKRPVSIKINVPYWVRNHDYVLRVYMSNASATATTEPNDEMFLVYENTSSESLRAHYKVKLSRAGTTTVTATFSKAHAPVLATGDVIRVTSTNGSFGSGTFTLTGASATTVTYVDATAANTTSATNQDIEGDTTAFGWTASTKQFAITVSTSDALRGGPLYTNPSQEGILQSNSTPPRCRDIALYKGHMFYAHTQQRGRGIFRLLSVDSTSGGMSNGDTLFINAGDTFTLTATAATQDTSGSFIRVTTGTSSQNIADTARNIVRAINEYGGYITPGPVQAYYLSGQYDPPGMIAVEMRELGVQSQQSRGSWSSGGAADNFTISCNAASSASYYEPEIRNRAQIDAGGITATASKTGKTVTLSFSDSHGLKTGDYIDYSSGSASTSAGPRQVTVLSSVAVKFEDFQYTAGTTAPSVGSVYRTTFWGNNQYAPNRVYYSKQNEPEHVPQENYFDIGSEQYAIVRIHAANDALWVMKEDGIYRIKGETVEDFDWDEFDLTVKIIAPESVASVSNQLFFLSNGGPVAVSDTGVVKVGRPIEQDVLKLYAHAPTAVRNASTACSYESEGLYILCMPDVSTDDTLADNTLAWVYSVFSSSGVWSKWDVDWTWCQVRADDDILVAGDAAGSFLLEERKNRNARDYADKGFGRTGEGNLTDAVITVTSASGTTMVLDSSAPSYAVGDVIYLSDTARAIVTAVNSSTSVEVSVSQGNISAFSGQTVTVYKAYQFTAQWQPITGDNPAESKHFTEALVEFRTAFFSSLKVGFISDKSKTIEKFTLTGYAARGNEQSFPWDYSEFSGQEGSRTMRCPVPRQKSRATKLFVRVEHKVALERVQVQGIHVKPISGGGKADK
jgi:hypothetical protein